MVMHAFLSFSVLMGLPPDRDPASTSRLAVIQNAPHWVLTNQDGKEVRSSDLRGRVLLVSFVFTTCNGSFLKPEWVVEDVKLLFQEILQERKCGRKEVLLDWSN